VTARARRAAVAALLAAWAAVLSVAAAPAVGAPEPVPASMSSVQLRGGVVSGVLTVRGAGGAVDPGSVQAKIGRQSYPVTVRPRAPERRAVMLVVDTSGSMGATGMATVRRAVVPFLQGLPPDVLVGVVSFASTAGVDVPLTKDRDRVRKAVEALQSRGETSLYDGIATAVSALGTSGERSIILLSDGGDTRSTKATRASATAALRNARVRAEVVGFKTAESDNAVLRDFAAAGGGTVSAARSPAAVESAFRAAAASFSSQVTFTFPAPPGIRTVTPVVLTGTAGGARFTAQAPVDFSAAPVPTATPTPSETATVAPDAAGTPKAPEPPSAPPLARPLLAGLALTFLGLLGLGLAIAWPFLRSRRRKRVETIERYVTAGSTVRAQRDADKDSAISTSLVSLGERVMEGRESTSKTMALIERADLPLRAGEWWVLRLASVPVSIAVAMVLFRGGLGMKIFALLVGTVLGVLLPAVVLRFLAGRRAKQFETQLPDVLSLVASSLSTGFSLLQALDAVSKDAADPAAKEFGRALAETRIGTDVGTALERMGQRMASTNMEWTAMAIRIQREVGGNLSETLKTTAATIRDRESLNRHVRALSAEGRLSAYVLIALPVGIFFYTLQVNREYVELLWTRGLGMVMLGAGLVSITIGVFWMRKVVAVKV
jgi:tight adherence protein B